MPRPIDLTCVAEADARANVRNGPVFCNHEHPEGYWSCARRRGHQGSVHVSTRNNATQVNAKWTTEGEELP